MWKDEPCLFTIHCFRRSCPELPGASWNIAMDRVLSCQYCLEPPLPLTMAMTVLSVAAAGVLVPFATGANLRVEGARITLASKLASDLLEEVSREDFSNISTWNNFTESKGNLRDFRNVLFNDTVYAGFSRKAVCQSAYIGSVRCYLVTVRVYYEGSQLVELKRLISES